MKYFVFMTPLENKIDHMQINRVRGIHYEEGYGHFARLMSVLGLFLLYTARRTGTISKGSQRSRKLLRGVQTRLSGHPSLLRDSYLTSRLRLHLDTVSLTQLP
jgi:hypothetical protein